MMPKEYHSGNVVEFFTSDAFTDANGDPADPDSVTFRLMPPDGVEVSFTWPADAEVVRDGPGLFHTLVTVDTAGRYPYRFEGTGAVTVAAEDVILVRHSAFS